MAKKDHDKQSAESKDRETFQTEADFRAQLENSPVHGIDSPFVRSLIADNVKSRTDCIGILMQVFSRGRFLPAYWERYGLPDLAREFLELNLKRRAATLQKMLTKEIFELFKDKVNTVASKWTNWREQALEKRVRDVRGMAWSDWAAANIKLKCEWDDIIGEIDDLQKYLKELVIIVDERTDNPQDLMTLTVVVGNFAVSKNTLRRAIREGRLRDYNQDKTSKNSPVLVSESEVKKYWPQK
jgi:hypothetical protein